MENWRKCYGSRVGYRAAVCVVLLSGLLCLLIVQEALGVGNYVTRNAGSDGIHSVSNRRLLSTSSDTAVNCRDLHQINNGTEARCEFILTTGNCAKNRGILQYNRWVYCTMGDLVPLAIVILIIWLAFAFVSLAVCADKFFCPSLVVISKVLNLSPNIAGVTFLAFGNGAPDLFSAIAALSGGGDPSLGLGGLLGAGVFVTTVVCGTVVMARPFKAVERPFLRDAFFYLAGVYWIFFILWKGKIYLAEAVGFILFWICYVLTVIGSGAVYKRMKGQENDNLDIEKSLPNIDEVASEITDHESEADRTSVYSISRDIPFDTEDEWTTRIRSETELSFEAALVMEKHHHDIIVEGRYRSDTDVSFEDAIFLSETNKAYEQGGDLHSQELSVSDYGEEDIGKDIDTQSSTQTLTEHAQDNWCRALLRTLNPIDTHHWPEMAWYRKAYEVFKSPIMFIMTCTIPVVDYDRTNDGWNRYLRALQFFMVPTVIILLTQNGNVMLGGVFPLYGLALILGAVAALIILLTTTNATEPKGHDAFGFCAFLFALVWIYILATEVVSLLETMGLVFNISDAILGLTFLAWANCTGDLISNSLMARQGFSRMGFSACFGGPFFSMMLGFGVPMIISMASEGVTSLPMLMTGVQLILTSTIFFSVFSTILFLLVRNFHMTKHWSYYLYTLYVVFLVVAILCEAGVILDGWRPW